VPCRRPVWRRSSGGAPSELEKAGTRARGQEGLVGEPGRPAVALDAVELIQNDSPEQLSIVFSGPDVRVEEVNACGECIDYVGVGPIACPEKGPVAEYVLAPGTYEVVVKSSSGANVTPFRGTWTLKKGEEYSSCFYLVSH